jgi:hypothetical protein
MKTPILLTKWFRGLKSKHEVDPTLPYNADVKNAGIETPLPSSLHNVLLRQRDN